MIWNKSWALRRSCIAANGQGFKQLGYGIPSPRAYCHWTKDTKADDIFCRPAELGRAGYAAGIFAADERRVGSPPQLLEAGVSGSFYCVHLNNFSANIFPPINLLLKWISFWANGHCPVFLRIRNANSASILSNCILSNPGKHQTKRWTFSFAFHL